MAKIDFSPENKMESSKDFPKLRLEQNEKARIVCLDLPDFAWVHSLRAPMVTDGVAEMYTNEKTGKEDYKMRFLSEPQCLGDYATIKAKGYDPDECAICDMASTGMTAKPYRRFALHTFQYATKPGTFTVSQPFSGQIAVWRFRDSVFGKLSDLQTEWGVLSEIDLNLGPCVAAVFQKFEVNNARECEWIKSDDRREYVNVSLEENSVPDLSALCGRKTELRWIESNLEEIRDAWDDAKSASSPSTPSKAKSTKTETAESLLDSPKDPESVSVGASSAPINTGKRRNFESLLGDIE